MQARLLFIGMWNFADDGGNIEGHPVKIKAQIFPGDTIDVSPLLSELIQKGLLISYDEGDNCRTSTAPVPRYLHIKGFTKHQIIRKPNYKCPEYKEYRTSTVPVPYQYGPEWNGMEEEGKGREYPPLPPQGEREKEENPQGEQDEQDEQAKAGPRLRATTPATTLADNQGESSNEGEQAKAGPRPGGMSTTLEKRFTQFYNAYPKKRAKGQAEKVWMRIRPGEQLLGAMLNALERAKTSVDWQKDGGQFIPHPATWLNAKGWEDEYTQVTTPPSQMDKTMSALQQAREIVEGTSKKVLGE